MYSINCQSYQIIIGDIKHHVEQFNFSKYSNVAILVDESTKLHCHPIIAENTVLNDAPIIEISSGEGNKNLLTCQYIWEAMLDLGMDRNSLLINLGGGVIGDMGGFCASTYMRGIDFIQIPTTLLSCVDSSVGGKLGVDFNRVKNIIGLFQNPKAVWIDTHFLKTLPPVQWRSGFAEMVKHALISANEFDLWQKCKEIYLKNTDFQPFDIDLQVLKRIIEVKRNVVESDFKESGLRKILNYGHTIGHALESYHLDTSQHLFHGEAVLAGMICENHIAYQKGWMQQEEMLSINSFLKHIFYNSSIVDPAQAIWELIQRDKKNKGKQVFASLIRTIGVGEPVVGITYEEVLQSLLYYKNL